MLRAGFIIGLLVLALAGAATAECWDCGASTGYSTTFKLDTEVSACTGWTVASADYLHDTIWSPGTIKKHPLGERVTLLSLPVTRTFAQRFYIEAVDRSSGIGVMAGVAADPGRLATVTGTLALVEGEIVLADEPGLPVEVTFGALGECPKPLGMSSAALRLGIGADPTAILARVWGKVIFEDPGGNYYVISDGGYDLVVVPDGVPTPGLDEFVRLSGIPGVATVGGQQARVFRVNAQ